MDSAAPEEKEGTRGRGDSVCREALGGEATCAGELRGRRRWKRGRRPQETGRDVKGFICGWPCWACLLRNLVVLEGRTKVKAAGFEPELNQQQGLSGAERSRRRPRAGTKD